MKIKRICALISAFTMLTACTSKEDSSSSSSKAEVSSKTESSSVTDSTTDSSTDEIPQLDTIFSGMMSLMVMLLMKQYGTMNHMNLAGQMKNFRNTQHQQIMFLFVTVL